MMLLMRTTLNLPDDVYEVARSLSIQKNLSLGDALGELVRGSLRITMRMDAALADGTEEFPTFPLGQNAEPITMQRTLELEDEW
jgi:hypothetical protein